MIDHTTLKPWRTDPETATKFVMDVDGNLVATFESRADAERACRLAAAERIQMENPGWKCSVSFKSYRDYLGSFTIRDDYGALCKPQKTPAEAWISAEQSQRKEGA